MSLSASQRALYGRIGAAVARSRHPAADLTAAARARFLERFEAQVRAEFPDVSDAEVQRRAGELRKAHFLRLAAMSSIARSKKRTPGLAKPDAQEVDRRDRSTPTTQV